MLIGANVGEDELVFSPHSIEYWTEKQDFNPNSAGLHYVDREYLKSLPASCIDYIALT